MRTNIFLALAAGGCLLGFQASAFAQAQSGLSNTPNQFVITQSAPEVAPPIVRERARPVRHYYGQNARLTLGRAGAVRPSGLSAAAGGKPVKNIAAGG